MRSECRSATLLRVLPIGLAALCAAAPLYALQQRGQVLSGTFPVPGATVTATQGSQRFSTVTDAEGFYTFPNLAAGAWTIHVAMPLFKPFEAQVTVAQNAPSSKWTLVMLSLDEAIAAVKARSESSTKATTAPQPQTSTQQATTGQGLLLNGSVNNAATSKYATAAAFGNTRKHSFNLYNGGLGFVFGNSALNARPYSLTGLETPQPAYNEVTLLASFGGPLNIPHLWNRGPNFSALYLWRRDSTAIAESGLVPTLLQRDSLVPDPDPIAATLLALYPLPNVAGSTDYNYQVPVVNNSHIDAPQIRMDRNVSAADSVAGSFALQSVRADDTNLFGFRDNIATLGIDSEVSYDHRFSNTLFAHLRYAFSRSRNEVTPYFKDRINIVGDAGLRGVAQDPANWGPPTLVFSSGIASLTDAQSAFNRKETNSIGGNVQWEIGSHTLTAGGDFRRQEFNYFQQQNPRGTFTFTGAAYGSDFADFLHGTPDTAAIVYGNPDKYLRQSVIDLYATDDWHMTPDFTVDYGVRWEYSAPVTEEKNRLANLDVSPSFGAAATVTAGDPVGPVSGSRFPNSLLRPDRTLVEPRLGVAWRPFAASSLLLRGGYGIYADTSLYQDIALQLAQQAPFARSISANNSTCPQSLATGPTACDGNTPDTFGIDPNFRVGYAQTWQLSAQDDLPAALQLVLTYLGIAGGHGVQQFLPNTYPLGAPDTCPLCPTGFLYEVSGGSSRRNSGSVQLRRRLRDGLTASILYTYSKSVDDDSVLGGQGPLAAGSDSAAPASATIAQNWLDLKAERSLSSFDQRHLVTGVLQYTTGMGLHGGTLLGGWLGRAYKEWTIVNTVTAGSGFPESPVYLAAVSDTGFSGSIRPDRTIAPLYTAPSGRYLNPAAYTAPQTGQWGTAGRNSITGPSQVTDDASLERTFRLSSKYHLDARADATNVLNHVVFKSYNTTVDPSLVSPIFGLPASPGSMRSIQFTLRLRF